MLCGFTELGVARALSLFFSRLVHSWFNEKTQRLSGVFQRGATNPMTVVFHIDTTICVCRTIYMNWAELKEIFCDNLYLVVGVLPAVSILQGLSRSLRRGRERIHRVSEGVFP